MSALIFIAFSYLLGSIPFGLAVGKRIRGIDIREHGSRNVGATNVSRVVGKPWGILVFLFDTLKGYLAVKIAELWFGDNVSIFLLILCGVAAILGHTFSIWLSFKGGKGVATSLGVFLALAFLPTIVAFGIWILFFTASHIISLSSLAAAACFPLLLLLLSRSQRGFGWLLLISILLALFIFYTHRTNIQRLLRGEEKKLF